MCRFGWVTSAKRKPDGLGLLGNGDWDEIIPDRNFESQADHAALRSAEMRCTNWGMKEPGLRTGKAKLKSIVTHLCNTLLSS